jgi:flagellar basal-body rod protein FlgB
MYVAWFTGRFIGEDVNFMDPVYGHKLFNRAFDIMGKALHLRLGRHSMATTNLANMDTPGYRVRDLKFEEAMERALGPKEGELQVRQTHRDHMPSGSVESAYDAARRSTEYSPYGQDEKGQDVMDMDKEMTKLAKNHLLYNATVQILAKEFETLKYAITEGGS